MEEFILLVEVASYLAATAGILYGLYKYWEWLINKKTEEAKAYRAVMDAAVEDTLMQKRVVEETYKDALYDKIPDLPIDSIKSYREAIENEARRRIYEAGSIPDEKIIGKLRNRFIE